MTKNDQIKKDIKKLDDILGTKSTKEIKVKKSLQLLQQIAQSVKEDKNGEVIEGLTLIQDDIKQLNASFVKSFGEESILTAFGDIVDAISESKEQNQEISEAASKDIVTALENLTKSVEAQEFPTEVAVTNQQEFPDEIKISNPQKEVEITNLDDLQKAIEAIKIPDTITVDNFPKQKESIKVSNFPKTLSLSKPSWFKQFTLDELKTAFNESFSALKDTVFKVRMKEHEKPANAIAVKLIDKDGKVIDNLIPHVTVSGGGGSGGGSAPSIVGLKNVADVNINPATLEKQNEMIAALGGSVSEALILAEDSGDSNISYIGKAAIASVSSGSVWKISRLDETTGVIITWADGDESYDNIFDDRESLSYS